jgi:hypothetical protein
MGVVGKNARTTSSPSTQQDIAAAPHGTDGICAIVGKSRSSFGKSAFSQTSLEWNTTARSSGCRRSRLNLSAYAERFVRSIKDEDLNRMIFIGEAALWRAIPGFLAHYRADRNDQRLG